MDRKKRIRAGRRSGEGLALAESGVALVLIIPALILGILLPMYIGTFVYYKLKLIYITQACAAYSASCTTWGNSFLPGVNQSSAQSTIEAMAKRLLATAGMPAPKKVTVNLSEFGNIGGGGTTVKIDLPPINILGCSLFWPRTYALSEKAAAPYPLDAPPGFLVLGMSQNPNEQIVVPAYGKYIPSFSTARNTPHQVPVGTASLRGTIRPYSSFQINIPTNSGTDAPGKPDKYYQQQVPGPSSADYPPSI